MKYNASLMWYMQRVTFVLYDRYQFKASYKGLRFNQSHAVAPKVVHCTFSIGISKPKIM